MPPTSLVSNYFWLYVIAGYLQCDFTHFFPKGYYDHNMAKLPCCPLNAIQLEAKWIQPVP
jgi:hypothetical protein